jgi:hypothetical protein
LEAERAEARAEEAEAVAQAAEAKAREAEARVGGAEAASVTGATTPGEELPSDEEELIQSGARGEGTGNVICAECGSGNRAERRFCRRCGASLENSRRSPSKWKRIFGRKVADSG